MAQLRLALFYALALYAISEIGRYYRHEAEIEIRLERVKRTWCT